MKENEIRHEPDDPGQFVSSAEDMHGDEFQIRLLLRSLWSYRRAIVGVVAGVMVVFATAAVAISSISPVERTGTLGFTLLFDGASEGLYPNGTTFSTAEITSAPVLTDVFDANDLERFSSFEAFSDSMFVLLKSHQNESLSLEYQTKLADSRLTLVDRSRLEDEFTTKLNSLSATSYTLNMRASTRITAMPASLTSKVLDDALTVWATQAREQKGALLYDIPLFSDNILRRDAVMDPDYIIGIDILRTQIARLIDNIGQIETLPGAWLLRTGDDRISLQESRAELEDILRFKIQVLVRLLVDTGLSKRPEGVPLYIEDQMFQMRLNRDEAEKNVQAVRAALRAYTGQEEAETIQTAGSGSRGTTLEQAQVNQGVVPQIGDSALDKLMEMSSLNSDLEYRQRLTDRVIRESLIVTSLEREQAYYVSSLPLLKDPLARTDENALKAQQMTIEAELRETFDMVATVFDNANAIYRELSTYNLDTTTHLYSITSPFTMRTERAISARDLRLQGLLVFVLSLIIVPFGCLGHSYFQKEIVHQETDKQGVRNDLGEQANGLHEEEPAKRRPLSS